MNVPYLTRGTKEALCAQIIPLLSEFILCSILGRFRTNRRRMALIRHPILREND